MATSLREIVQKMGEKQGSTSMPSKFDQLRTLLDEIEGMMSRPEGQVGRNEAPVAPAEKKIPMDMNAKKSIAVAVLKKKNKGMKA